MALARNRSGTASVEKDQPSKTFGAASPASALSVCDGRGRSAGAVRRDRCQPKAGSGIRRPTRCGMAPTPTASLPSGSVLETAPVGGVLRQANGPACSSISTRPTARVRRLRAGPVAARSLKSRAAFGAADQEPDTELFLELQGRSHDADAHGVGAIELGDGNPVSGSLRLACNLVLRRRRGRTLRKAGSRRLEGCLCWSRLRSGRRSLFNGRSRDRPAAHLVQPCIHRLLKPKAARGVIIHGSTCVAKRGSRDLFRCGSSSAAPPPSNLDTLFYARSASPPTAATGHTWTAMFSQPEPCA